MAAENAVGGIQSTRETTGDSRKVLLQEVDESVGGRVVGADGRVVLKLWLDLLGQLLPQFNASGGNRKSVKRRCPGLSAASCDWSETLTPTDRSC